MKLHFFFLIGIVLLSCNSKKEEETKLTSNKTNSVSKEILLIGTFHFNNPGADVAKTKAFDILGENSQKELDALTQRVVDFGPSKIFVEWPYDEQKELDSLYNIYKEGTYFQQGSLSDFYKKNEIFQWAFRIAKASDHDKVYAVDYNKTEFPFDSLMQVISERKQENLQKEIENGIQSFVNVFDEKIAQGASLRELLRYLNTEDLKKLSNRFHNELPLKAGNEDNFIGPYLTAEWYKRNLYMWSLIQKMTTTEDDKIMVLLGASHAAIIETFIDSNTNWSLYPIDHIFQQQ
ncbi:MAG: hypothetical protein CL596_02975 [Alteromonas sp.]|nr:hypothetical protein [Alteromonas sp.]MAY21379.1 hypothetical protein [Flavobacteriaceae bacterium]|tara:strand:- start:11465 stop:12337 length:873 start_codon:yes stop_codon:yes gene_type:complete